MVKVFPGCVLIQWSAAVFIYRFSGPKTLLSSGWRWWEQWGGNDSRTIPFDQQKSQMGLTNDCLGGEARSTPGSHGCVWQSAGERPESLYPVSNLSYLQNQQSQWDHFSLLFMGKIKYRAMQLPCAFTARAMVTDVPLSPEVTEPTWCFPLVAIILSGTWTVVVPEK